MAKNKQVKIGPDVDYEMACKVSERVNLIDVRLEKSDCFQKPNHAKTISDFDISCDVSVYANRQNKLIVVLPTLSLNGFFEEIRDDSANKEPDFYIKATFILIYKADNFDGLDENNYQAFAQSNGIFNTWPYWREYIQNTTSRMGIPPLTIPVFRICGPEKNTKKIKKKTTAKTKKTTTRSTTKSKNTPQKK